MSIWTCFGVFGGKEKRRGVGVPIISGSWDNVGGKNIASAQEKIAGQRAHAKRQLGSALDHICSILDQLGKNQVAGTDKYSNAKTYCSGLYDALQAVEEQIKKNEIQSEQEWCALNELLAAWGKYCHDVSKCLEAEILFDAESRLREQAEPSPVSAPIADHWLERTKSVKKLEVTTYKKDISAHVQQCLALYNEFFLMSKEDKLSEARTRAMLIIGAGFLFIPFGQVGGLGLLLKGIYDLYQSWKQTDNAVSDNMRAVLGKLDNLEDFVLAGEQPEQHVMSV